MKRQPIGLRSQKDNKLWHILATHPAYLHNARRRRSQTYVVTVGSGGPSVGNAGPATEANKNVLSGAGGSGVVIVRYPLP